jgi:hypothetical protein
MTSAFIIDGSQGQVSPNLIGNSYIPDVTFDVVVTNPCLTAAIDAFVLSPASISVTDGNIETATFSIPQDAVDKTNTV